MSYYRAAEIDDAVARARIEYGKNGGFLFLGTVMKLHNMGLDVPALESTFEEESACGEAAA